MAIPVLVTGDAILTQAGTDSPEADDQEWADACAAATQAGIVRRIDRPDDDPTWDVATPELSEAALIAGVEAYKRREAPFGVTGYADLQGIAVRVARDPIETVGPILDRWRKVAIG